jgi:O-antigen/teichoic acid export membrane protein
LKLRRDLALTMLLQAGGGAATLLAALWIGRALGPAQQGQFNQIKSLVDLGAALAALGMPQALYVYVQSGRLALNEARRLALRVALLGMPVGAGLAAWHFGANVWALAAALAVASALAALQQQWRALALLGAATWRFNLVTVAPQVLLLPLAAGVVLAGGASAGALAWGLAALWLLAAGYAGHTARRTPAPTVSGEPATRGQLLRHGGASWATVSFAALGIVVLQSLAQRLDGDAGLGRFSLALLLVQLPLTPLNYAIPLLLRHRLTAHGSLRLARHLPWLLIPMLVLAAAVAVLGAARSDLWMGAGYRGLHAPLAWLLVAGAAEAGIRMGSVDAQAESRPGRSAWAEGLRVALLGLSALVLPAGATLTTLAMAWAAASWGALALLLALSRRGRSR